jgi:hypothetical protein
MAFQLSSTAFYFPWRLSTFFNGFPIFLDGFPIFKKSKKIYLRQQAYERSLFKLRISCHLLPELYNSRYNVYISPTLTHYVSFGQINDIIGDEEWLQGGGNCLCNIASS